MSEDASANSATPGKAVQLRMLYPAGPSTKPPVISPPEGYSVRQFGANDTEGFLEVMAAAGWPDWNHALIEKCRERVLADGWFLVEHEPTGRIVATTMAQRDREEFGEPGGEIGWVAADPDHAGNGLGTLVSAAATRRLLTEGFKYVHLYTDDWRLPAIKTYLKLGYHAWARSEQDFQRWNVVGERLGLPVPIQRP